jgi:class 3 adenylate cyclase
VRDAEVHYARHRGGKRLAYEVFGSGPSDLLVYQVSFPIDLMWELPQLASFMETLGGFARVIVFDAPGHGASDPLWDFSAAATIETLCDGFSAVLDAAHADRVTFLDMAYGVNGVTFAATYPGRVRSLIINNFCSSFPDIRDATAAERRQRADERIGIESLESENPRVAHDPQLRQWWRRARRLLVSPHASLLQMDFAAQIDVEEVLSAVRTPTLVLHRRENPVWDIETSRAAAAKLPQARFVDLPGSETDLFLGDTAPVLSEIERFLDEPETRASSDRVLATVLFTDIVASTEQLAASGDDAWGRALDEHDRTMQRLVGNYRGRVVKSTGDGILATFDGPARAVRCAAEMIDAASQQGITLRAGLHTGEIEFRSNDLIGIAVHTANRISALAGPSEILVSRTVVDLTAGSGLQFESRGEHELKGVRGTWPTFAAVRSI